MARAGGVGVFAVEPAGGVLGAGGALGGWVAGVAAGAWEAGADDGGVTETGRPMRLLRPRPRRDCFAGGAAGAAGFPGVGVDGLAGVDGFPGVDWLPGVGLATWNLRVRVVRERVRFRECTVAMTGEQERSTWNAFVRAAIDRWWELARR